MSEDCVMATTKSTQNDPQGEHLGDETFMSAADLRNYMTEMQMAKASKEVDVMGRADKAREALIKSLSTPIEVTPEKIQEVTQNLLYKLRSAAKRGQTELMVLRFPTALCSDKGRAINNADSDWPETLSGRPRQAYEFWRDHLRAAGYRLSATVIDWPGGMPGDVGFFLRWGDTKR
jgi:hypothetical protein